MSDTSYDRILGGSDDTDRADDHQEDDPLIEVDQLRTYYDEGGGRFSKPPVKAVDGVSFDVFRGETLGLVGESGCGKTTLGRTLVRLESATDGEVLFDGTDITTLSGSDLKEWRRRAQVVFQDPDSSLNDRMTVGELVQEPLDVYEWETNSDRRRRVKDLLDTVGLREEHYYRYPHQFSGGQKQRVGIARALALQPEFIVLDEPVSALDVSVQAQILNLLEDLQEKFNLTYLFIAHNLSVVRHICDRVAVMYLGKIMEIGGTERLFSHAANPYTMSLLSAVPEPDPTVDADRITLRGVPPNPRNPPAGCPFSTRCPVKIRPENFSEIDKEVWEAISAYQRIVRERAADDPTLSEFVRDLLGREQQKVEAEEIRSEVFDGIELPGDVEQALDEATEILRNDPEEAEKYVLNAFSSVCDDTEPEYHPQESPTQLSYCHRHRSEYEDATDVATEAAGFPNDS